MRHSVSFSTRARGRSLTFESLEARLPLAASDLRITEFVASNDESHLDYDGDSSDWVELYNSGTDAVDLAGLYLTDNANNKTKWQFPAGSGSIGAGGYRIVFASNKNTIKPNGEIHTSFALSADGEYLGLVSSNGTTVIDQFAPKFPAQFEDISYGRAMVSTGGPTTIVATGAQSKSWIPTSGIYDATWTSRTFNDSAFTIVGPTGVGYEQDPGGAVNFTAEIGRTIPVGTTSVYTRINFNLSTLAGIDRLTLRMRYDDGFVTYVNGIRVAEGLAPEVAQWNSVATGQHPDSEAEQFVDFDVSIVIPYLHVGANVLAIHGLNRESASSDMLISPELVAAATQIVVPNDIGYFDVPTPGYGNGDTSYSGFAEEPVMSVPHGFYGSTQSVSMSTTTPGAIIVYTTDGSTPSVNAGLGVTNGTLHTVPINVSSTTTLRASAFKLDWKPSFITASSYLFVNDIVNQSPSGQLPGPGWAPNGTNGQEINYGIDPDIIALYGAEAIKNSLTSLPSISITTDLANLFNSSTGVYVNALNRGRPWERPASVELIDPSGAEEGFTVNAGLRIRGGYSRNDFNPKHAFRLYFRGEYGAGHLEYPLFGEEGADEFDVIDLRCEQTYSWASWGNQQESFVREVFARDTMNDLGHQYTRSRYYHLYLDGVYWGLYQTQERVEEFYGETYYGGDETDYDVVKHGLNDVGGTEISAGNDIAWRQLFEYAEALAANYQANGNLYWTMQGLNPDGTRNESLPVLLDVDSVITFMSVVIFTGGYDSGLSQVLGDNLANNWFGLYNRETADRGFQFFVHDNELSMGIGSSLHSTAAIDRTGPFNNGNQSNYAQFNPQYLHQDLLGHPEYRQKFIDHVQREYFNGGALTVASNVARLLERKNQVDPAIIAEAARWGDSKVTTPFNKAYWQNEISWLSNTYLQIRNDMVLNQLRNDGLFTTFAAPSFNQHGGNVNHGFGLTMTASAGTIYFTTDGVTDPRLIGGGVNFGASTYVGQIPLTNDVTVKARLLSNTGIWSGLVEATFNVVSRAGDYDRDGTVASADYQFWKQHFGGTSGIGLQADGNGNGVVDAADYTIWRDNLNPELPGAVASAGAASNAIAAAPAKFVASFDIVRESHPANPSELVKSSEVAPQTSRHRQLMPVSSRESREVRPSVSRSNRATNSIDEALLLSLESHAWQDPLDDQELDSTSTLSGRQAVISSQVNDECFADEAFLPSFLEVHLWS
jgi:hypothetical protein